MGHSPVGLNLVLKQYSCQLTAQKQFEAQFSPERVHKRRTVRGLSQQQCMSHEEGAVLGACMLEWHQEQPALPCRRFWLRNDAHLCSGQDFSALQRVLGVMGG